MSHMLKLTNTLTREKAEFQPIDPENVRMYVCGPTVYDFAHIGNARPVIVFDVLFRLLRHIYGEAHVTYARNITDVDDKINARALRDFGAKIADGSMSLNEAIRAVTGKTESQFQSDVKALGCLEPTHQPRATDNIAQMIEIIQRLLTKGHAYVAKGSEGHEVLFATASMADYGQLSKRKLEDQQAGARVAVEAHKTNPGDFVLWKQSADTEPGWAAQFTFEGETYAIYGRPGWHIECSAMANRYLWEEIKDRLSPKGKARPHEFDIHGGGLDLIFPHHENEIAQSCCAYDTDVMASVWMHNGFVQVEGRKMSKSDGNFVTIHELLATEKFGGRTWHGGVLRLALLKTHYREPLDFTVSSLVDARKDMERFFNAGSRYNAWSFVGDWMRAGLTEPYPEVLEALSQDLNTPLAISILRQKAGTSFSFDKNEAVQFASTVQFLSLMNPQNAGSFASNGPLSDSVSMAALRIPNYWEMVESLRVSFSNGDQNAIDRITEVFKNEGEQVVLTGDGDFRLEALNPNERGEQELQVQYAIDQRLELLKAKNFAEADRIRDELLAKGIQLKDGKDAATGERVTTWEVKR
ncbi:cysteine--tRNA ligase [Rhizobium sp. FY34]|uniref:cysteine--tRNA ligase n=1 Tax=Rhizobium sp. FY34 TaxID=2562309 RepID=UPI0010BF86DB|nr:cysteine--tRNA ligase [Rhizobium sp. FY34]